MHNASFPSPVATPLVALIGGAGFVGTAVAEAFARAGWRIRVACRDLAHAQHLRPLGDVGQIGFVQADVTVPRSLPRVVEGAAAPVMPVVAGDTRFQPVYVADVAAAVLEVANRMLAGGVGGVFELGGPEVLSMRQLLAGIAAECDRDIRFVDVPDMGARLLGALPGAPVTKDQLAMLKRDNVASAALPGLAELGVQPTPLSAVAQLWLSRYRPGGRFAA